jgi:hypothetical protein
VGLIVLAAIVGALAGGGGGGDGSEPGSGGSQGMADLAAPTDVTVAADECSGGECRASVSYVDGSEGESSVEVVFAPASTADGEPEAKETAGPQVEGTGSTGTAGRSIPQNARYCVEVRAVAGTDRSDAAEPAPCFAISRTGVLALDPLAPWELEQGSCVALLDGDQFQPGDTQASWFVTSECTLAPGVGRVYLRIDQFVGDGGQTCTDEGRAQQVVGAFTSFVRADAQGDDVLVCINHS